MNISIIGIGMGNCETLTMKADELLREADLIIGAKRILDSLSDDYKGDRITEIYSEKILNYIKNSNCENAVVAMSGDTGFYSGATKLLELTENSCNFDVKVYPGISSMQYFASKLNRPWQDFRLVSAHGKDCNVLGEILSNRLTFFLTGGGIMAHDIVKILCDSGLGETEISIGERLSYEDERIIVDKAKNVKDLKFVNLSVILVDRKDDFEGEKYCGSIADDEFIRDDVPMTKRDVRGAIVSRMDIKDDEVIYDVGAGTGSCSIEMAKANKKAKIYAVEVKSEACDLIKLNAVKFKANNITLVVGKAPDALENLPVADAAFIGGSKGNLEEIVKFLLEKNENIRIVISAVTYETLIEGITVLKKNKFNNLDITQISVTNTRKVASYNMLNAQNPVFLISGKGGLNEK